MGYKRNNVNMKKNWTGERLETNIQNETSVEHLHRYAIALDYAKDKLILDIACGEGYGSNLLSNIASFVHGVDIDNTTIENAKKKYIKSNLAFLEGSTSQIPLGSSSVDVVVSFETIEHHNEHDQMLKEIKRVMRPDGILIISSPEKYTKEPWNKYHVKELTNVEFQSLILENFKNATFLSQKIFLGSIVTTQTSNSNLFNEYSGNFNSLIRNNKLVNPVFNICFASDSALPEIGNSIYDGKDDIFENYTKPFKNSRIYKFSQFFIKKLKK